MLANPANPSEDKLFCVSCGASLHSDFGVLCEDCRQRLEYLYYNEK